MGWHKLPSISYYANYMEKNTYNGCKCIQCVIYYYKHVYLRIECQCWATTRTIVMPSNLAYSYVGDVIYDIQLLPILHTIQL